MKNPLLLIGVSAGAAVLLGMVIPQSFALSPLPGRSTIEIPTDGGVIGVEVLLDRGRPLLFASVAVDRWRLQGATGDLIGKPYSIRLTNRTPHRVKVVVGVDGLNVYRRSSVIGRADRDVGSILSPWDERRLTGWQLDHDSAERFVLSPSEWSEGRGRTDSKIGLVSVQVYLERRNRWERDADQYSGQGEKRRERSADRCAPEAAPGIGTSSGDEITSRVRTVHFDASSTFPMAQAIIDYGGQAFPQEAPRRLFGMELDRVRDGSAVMSIALGSRADEAGIQRGDIIVRIDSEGSPAPDVVERILRSKRPADRVFFNLRRGRHEVALKVRI